MLLQNNTCMIIKSKHENEVAYWRLLLTRLACPNLEAMPNKIIHGTCMISHLYNYSLVDIIKPSCNNVHTVNTCNLN